MNWYDIRDPQDPQLEELARQYNLHPLHMEDAATATSSAKVERQNDYLFIVFKPSRWMRVLLEHRDFDFFIGPDWLITVQEEKCAAVTNAFECSRVRWPRSCDQMRSSIG